MNYGVVSGRTDTWYRKLPTEERGSPRMKRFYIGGGVKAVESSVRVGGLKHRLLKALVRISSQGTEEIGDTGVEKATGERNREGKR